MNLRKLFRLFVTAQKIHTKKIPCDSEGEPIHPGDLVYYRAKPGFNRPFIDKQLLVLRSPGHGIDQQSHYVIGLSQTNPEKLEECFVGEDEITLYEQAKHILPAKIIQG